MNSGINALQQNMLAKQSNVANSLWLARGDSETGVLSVA
jgi:hypothetical protein